MRPILKSPRILRTGQPLTLEGIRQVAPAVFAEGPHESRGEHYRYVPTIEPLQRLLATGWGVYEASQQRSRAADKDPYTKHMLRMRRLQDFDSKAAGADGVAEVIMINGHDGSAAYQMKAGYFRFVCSNGIISGKTMAGFKVYHSVNRQTSDEVLGAAENLVVDAFPKMLEKIVNFKTIELTPEQQARMARAALQARYGSALPPFPASDLLHVRREEDGFPSLWNVLNRVQEAALYGGWGVKSFAGRDVEVRPVERVSAVTTINEAIWDEAHAIAEECTA